MSRDIKKKLESNLHFAEFAIDHASDAAFWMDHNAQFIYVNHAACRSLGYKKEDLLTMTVHDIDPNFPKEAWPDHWSDLKQKGSFVFESQHRTKKGRIYPVEIVVNYVKFNEKEYNCAFVRDISKRKQLEEYQTKMNVELEKKVQLRTADLEEINTALKILLQQRDNDQGEIEEKILSNIKELVIPYLEKLMTFKMKAAHKKLIDIIMSNLQDITSPLIHNLSSGYLKLTPMEIRVANLVRHGKSSKEIANSLNMSKSTIDTHRYHIRKKLGIHNKKINLRTHLLTLSQ